ncbi:O-antigen ligase family protein [Sphingomonas sp. CFBP 8760]|uniref:O-antigen ligase family protein n=1 Tax=Sphingomonas sp. CFBP 8760 TaxID=2775282 RepID=UPI0017817989|nr:O-antigen ligase family protein [Sphingomonas sp. CFBP 8760]MBD8548177.1 O-antigen ligase family protein [Sphingomonas sp. CFBP 8760]
MNPISKFERLSPTFWVLAVYLTCVFLMGGGSRGDIASLILLRPIAVILCAWALVRFDTAAWHRWRRLLMLAGALFALTAFHLIPLPAAIWQALPGRELVITIGRSIGSPDDVRPLSLSPLDTWNALFSLFVPLAVLLLGIGLTERERHHLLFVMLAIGALSATMGALQALSPGNTALHFYRFDNPNASDGLFANRNHQALLLACLIPMLAVFAQSGERGRLTRRKGVMAAGILILIPLLLVTGSRAGLVLGVLASLSLLLLMSRTVTKRDDHGWRSWLNDPRLLVGAAAVMLVGVIILSRRAEAFRRLFASSPAEESRLQIWQPAIHAIGEFMPWGSGIGSFVSSYQVYETYNILSPTYRNHAHNEFLEIAMTGGLPALLILGVAIFGWVRVTWQWMMQPPRSPEILYGRLGSVIVFTFAVGSIVDYPARVPSLACLLTLAALWMGGRKSDHATSTGSDTMHSR